LVEAEAAIPLILQPVGSGNQIEQTIACDIMRDDFLPIVNLGQDSCGPGMSPGIGGHLEKLWEVVFSQVDAVVAGYKGEPPIGKHRSNDCPVRPVAVPHADGVFFPVPIDGIDGLDPAKLA
jgi:hypothetical protein